jgi:uncharacterized SAM-dependent methyltransferase
MQSVVQQRPDAQRLALVAMLRDGLARRQPELPSRYRWLAGDEEQRAAVAALPEPRLGAVERALLADVRAPRACALVHLEPEMVGAAREDVVGLLRDYTEPQYIAISAMADFTRELPLPPRIERPRLVICQSNLLGNRDTIGAVRLLRAIRAVMRTGDHLLLGVDTRSDGAELERAHDDDAGVQSAFYRSTLLAVNHELDTAFETDDYRYQARFVPALRRVDHLLVAVRRHTVTIDDTPWTIRKGASILIGISVTFTRSILTAMLHGVGLQVVDWRTDERERFAVATASVATSFADA